MRGRDVFNFEIRNIYYALLNFASEPSWRPPPPFNQSLSTKNCIINLIPISTDKNKIKNYRHASFHFFATNHFSSNASLFSCVLSKSIQHFIFILLENVSLQCEILLNTCNLFNNNNNNNN